MFTKNPQTAYIGGLGAFCVRIRLCMQKEDKVFLVFYIIIKKKIDFAVFW